MGGVEPARNADDHALAADCAQPLGQPGDLNIVRLVAILLEAGGIGRHKRIALDPAFQPDIAERRVEPERDAPERNGMVAAVGFEAAHLHALMAQQTQIDVGDGELGGGRKPLGFGQRGTVLEDRCLAVPGQIGGGFAGTRGGVKVRRDAARGLRRAQQPARFGLADGDVAGGEVGENGGAGQCGLRAGRHRDPDVLADLRMHDKIRHVLGRVQQVDTERGDQSADRNLASRRPVARDKMAGFVELAIVRQVQLGHHAQQRAAMDRQRAVVQRPGVPQRCADQQQGPQTG